MCSNAINCSTIVSETLMGCCIIHSARLALAVRLNSPQHGTVLFVISWSLHNQSHSGQLLISLETWGWLCSNNNDNSCRFSNPPPKLCRWHRGTLIYGQINNRSGHSCIRPSQGSLIFFIAIFNLWVSFRARCVQGSLFPSSISVDYAKWKQKPISTTHNGLCLLILYCADCKFSHYIWTTSITAAFTLPRDGGRSSTEMLLYFLRTIMALYWAAAQLP